MEGSISQRTALKVALTSQRRTNKDDGEECGRSANSGHIVEVMTAEEELVLITNTLKASAFISHNISQRRNTEGDEGSWKCEMTLDGGRILPTWRVASPYVGVAVFLRGGLGFPTWRVWVRYME